MGNKLSCHENINNSTLSQGKTLVNLLVFVTSGVKSTVALSHELKKSTMMNSFE